MVKQIDLNLTNSSYTILIGKNILSKAVKRINGLKPDKCLFIIDKKVFELHGLNIRKVFSGIESKSFTYLYTASEKNKSFKETIKIQKFLVENNFSRGSLIVAIGGGITGDIAGFSASTFMRGIKLIQLPTTLLSMVDSSVGGKTGINFMNRKNIIGSFYQPDSVFIDTIFLKTLPKREILSGTGELVKYSFLADKENYHKLLNQIKKITNDNKPDYIDVIFRSITIKKNIVINDEKEISGLRKILNLGHTFAHAFESASKNKISHGESVLAGIICALHLSSRLGYLSGSKLSKFLSDYDFLNFNPLFHKINVESSIEYMKDDKKSFNEEIRFVLLEDIGKIVVDVIADKPSVLESIKGMQIYLLKKVRFKRGKLSSFEGET